MTQTIRAGSRAQTDPVKGSRFIASTAPVADEDSARAFLARTAEEMPDASHHCWAWRLATPVIERAGDDGEPGGSAGRPILAQITGRELVNVAVVVSRWFGGTKLGVGGLVRAYGAAAALALDAADIEPYVPLLAASVRYGYGDVDVVQRILRRHGATDIDLSYETDIIHRFDLPSSAIDAVADDLANGTSGRVRLALTTDDA